jgi:Zn-dependent protease with chaperone function
MRHGAGITALLFVVVLGVAGVPPAGAQSPPPATTATPTATSPTTSATVAPPVPSDAGAPVPVPTPSEKAMRYYRSGNVLWAVAMLWGFAVPLLLLSTGLSAKLRDLARRVGRRWVFTVAVYGVLFAVVGFVLDLPLAWYADFVRQHAYGLSDQTAAKWWSDAFKALALSCIFNAAFLWVPYLLLRKSPRRWWLYTALLAIPLLAAILIVTPIWIEPLFNKFGPMKDKALEAQILALADRAGIEGSRVFEVNKSVDTKTLNAYVAGIFGTKRIVLWDTIIKRMTDRELLFVMGHEMGHYVLGHVWKMIFAFSVIALIAALILWRLTPWMLARWGRRWRVESVADPAVVPAFALILTIFGLVLTPVLNTVIRSEESEADAFGLDAAREPDGFASVAMKLSEYRKIEPSPLEEAIFFDHPSGRTRVRMSMDWKARHLAELPPDQRGMVTPPPPRAAPSGGR